MFLISLVLNYNFRVNFNAICFIFLAKFNKTVKKVLRSKFAAKKHSTIL